MKLEKIYKIFQMSLRYLAIKETLYNLPKDELKEIVNEIIINFSNNELNDLDKKIENIIEDRRIFADKKFHEQINQLTKIPLEGRDWVIYFPSKNEIVIKWIYYYDINNIKYKLWMTVTEDKMIIQRKIVCMFHSPHFCSNLCYISGDESILGTAKINKENGDLLIEMHGDEWKEWTNKTFLLYSSIFFNFRLIYDDYFIKKF